MAREVVLKDDLDGSYDDVQTVTLVWGAQSVEVDLSVANRKQLDELLTPYLRAGRKRRPAASPQRGRQRPPKAEQERRAAVRAWAAEQGIEVSVRGPIPEHVLDLYDKRGQE